MKPIRQTHRTLILGFLLAVCSFLALVGEAPKQFDTPVSLFIGLYVVLLLAFIFSLRTDRRRYEDAYRTFLIQEALTRERFGIAQELHDIISDGLALIHLRASVARHLGQQDADQAVQALRDVEEASRHTISQLRDLLLILRDQPVASPRPSQGLAVQSSTQNQSSANLSNDHLNPSASLNAIVASASHASLKVSTTDDLDGLTADLPIPIRSVLADTLREGLANCARHAGATRVTVSLTHEDNQVICTILDEGPTPGWQPMIGSGLGLNLIRDKANALGGQLLAGPRLDQAGFSLSLTLPLPDSGDKGGIGG